MVENQFWMFYIECSHMLRERKMVTDKIHMQHCISRKTATNEQKIINKSYEDSLVGSNLCCEWFVKFKFKPYTYTNVMVNHKNLEVMTFKLC